MTRRIAICVATYKRPALLDRLLRSLAELESPADTELEIRVVDNDAAATARETVSHHQGSSPLVERIRYRVEPVSNIAIARNRGVEMGPADLIMFIDDDEIAEPDCLKELVTARDMTGADAVMGFVGGILPPDAPTWMDRGAFFDHPTGESGAPLHWRGTRCGCTLVDGRWFSDEGARFDPAFGRSGAEDVELFARLARLGAWYTSAPRARALESIDSSRARLRWLWRRYWRNGLCYHRLTRYDSSARHPIVQFCGRCVRSAAQALLGLPTMVVGRPERVARGVLGFALAGGGLVAWLAPDRARGNVSYGSEAAPPNHATGNPALSSTEIPNEMTDPCVSHS